MMNKIGIFGLALMLSIGVQTFAFQPALNGLPGLATEKHLVIRDSRGMQVYEVSDNPQTEEERAIYTAWLEAQVWDLTKQLGAINVPKCESEEIIRASGISEKITALTARISAFIGR